MQVLEKVMKRYDEEKNRPVHQVVPVSLHRRRSEEYILNELTRKRMLFLRRKYF